MIFFRQNLKYLRGCKNLKINELVNELGFSRTQWTNYENNTSYPKFSDLIEIAKYFDISETSLIHDDLKNMKEENNNRIENQYTIEVQKKYIEILESEISKLKKAKEPVFYTGMVAEPEQKLKK